MLIHRNEHLSSVLLATKIAKVRAKPIRFLNPTSKLSLRSITLDFCYDFISGGKISKKNHLFGGVPHAKNVLFSIFFDIT